MCACRLLRWLERMHFSKAVQIGTLFAAMCLLSHWLACIWFMMFKYGGSTHAEEWTFMVHAVDTAIERYLDLYYSSFLLLVSAAVAHTQRKTVHGWRR